MRYRPWDLGRVATFDDEISRIMKQERIMGRSLAMEAAEAAGAFEAARELAKPLREDLVTGRSIAQELAAATKSLTADARAASPLVAASDATAALAEAIDRQAIFESAAGLRLPPDAVAQITGPDRSATQAVLDHLKAIQAAGAELAPLHREGVATLLAERETLDRYVRNTAAMFDWQRIGQALGPIDELQRATGEMLESYRALSDPSVTMVLGDLSFSLDGFPRIETYAHTNLLRGLSRGGTAKPKEKEKEQEQEEEDPRLKEEVAEQGSTTLHSLLTVHHADLAHMWHGAKAAFHSGNPDYVRQYSASQRQLLLQLLLRVAPEGEVRTWTSDPEHFWNRETSNQPTWKARILYLCARADRKRFGHFAVADAKAALEVYDRLNRGVHRVEPDFSPREVTDLQIRADNLILFIVLLSLEERS